jgi:putative RecB family exonuclease
VDRVKFGSIPLFAKRKTETPALRLSPSSIGTFRQCRLQYKFRYIDKLGDKYGGPRPYYTMANHVHATLEHLLSSVPVQDRTVKTAEALLKKKWRRYRVGFRNRADEERWAQRALAQITRFVVEQDVTVTPLMVEKALETEITRGLILRGRLDRVDRELDGSLHIIDYKTGIRPEATDWSQLDLHALILSRSTSYRVSRVSYYYLLSGEREGKELDAKVLDQTTWELFRVAGEIRKEKHYRPHPGPACGGCDFAVICPARDDGYVETGEGELPLWRDFSEMLDGE